MFLLAHDERSGKPRINLDVLGLGLVAAALTELAIAGAVYIDPDTGQVTRYAADPLTDAAAQYVLEQVVKGEPQTYSATEWITVLREDLYGGVAQNLEAANCVKAERSALGRGVRYVPTPRSLGEDPLAWVFGILGSRSHHAVDYELDKQALACLCAAMGVASAIIAIPPEEVEANYAELLRSCDPQLVALARATAQVKRKLSMMVRR